MINCPSCAKQNQDHYKFCLGCGAELPREPVGQSTLDETAPHGVPASAEIDDEVTSVGTGDKASPFAQPPSTSAPEPEAAAAQGGAAQGGAPDGACPQCSHPNPPANRFCASCGFKLTVAKKSQTKPPPSKSPAAAASTEELSGVVLTALNPDGTEAGTYDLPKGITTLGRDTGGIFAGDNYLSPKHAVFNPGDGKLRVKDIGSLNGVFRKLLADQRYELLPNQVFRIGQELIIFEQLEDDGTDSDGVETMGAPVEGYVGRISMMLGRETTGTAFPIPETGLNLGRERGEVLFSDDGYVSGLHCRMSYEDGKVYLTDLGSSNGTFVRLVGEEEVTNGDILLMGQQLFRITM